MDHFKFIPKMNNPAIVITTTISTNIKNWRLINKIFCLAAEKVSKIINTPLQVSLQNIMNTESQCTNKEHELDLFENESQLPCYICVHCLQKFKKAVKKNNTFFSNGGGNNGL